MKKFIIGINRKFDKLEEPKRFMVFFLVVGTTLAGSMYFLYLKNSNPLFIIAWLLIFGIGRLYYLKAEKNGGSSETKDAVSESPKGEMTQPNFSMSMGFIHDHSEEDIVTHARKMIEEIELIVSENIDERDKEVGDRIRIWDGSGNKDKKTGEKRYGVDPLFQNYNAIVIETGCNVYADNDPYKNIHIRAGVWDRMNYHLDLLVAYPTGEEIYVASKFVKIVD